MQGVLQPGDTAWWLGLVSESHAFAFRSQESRFATLAPIFQLKITLCFWRQESRYAARAILQLALLVFGSEASILNQSSTMRNILNMIERSCSRVLNTAICLFSNTRFPNYLKLGNIFLIPVKIPWTKTIFFPSLRLFKKSFSFLSQRKNSKGKCIKIHFNSP